jgi:hypothetical protein
VRAANRHARCAPQAIFARLAGNWDVLPKFTVNYGKLRQITPNYGGFVAAQATLRARSRHLGFVKVVS